MCCAGSRDLVSLLKVSCYEICYTSLVMHPCIMIYPATYLPKYSMHNTYIHSYMHTFIYTYIHACSHIYIHTCMQTYIHSYIHTTMLPNQGFASIGWKQAPSLDLLLKSATLFNCLFELIKNTVASDLQLKAAPRACHAFRPCIFTKLMITLEVNELSSCIRRVAMKWRIVAQSPDSRRIVWSRVLSTNILYFVLHHVCNNVSFIFVRCKCKSLLKTMYM